MQSAISTPRRGGDRKPKLKLKQQMKRQSLLGTNRVGAGENRRLGVETRE
ncbi:hypothetical protein CCACVL1_10962 [Corchorus capsularis]|uniref:Uncharacterized protein n=1 Tax=Corchorus capsularis TaxID=210143 RepID=A0A1R3INL0_COCAP|nr:hypothetical protein CCACVL1_10962 [Corchorus capsularis]